MPPLPTHLAEPPSSFLLEAQTVDALTTYLRDQQWIRADESVNSTEKPGEGNMNFVIRATTNHRSFILKQALPYVYRYPQVDAPVGRGESEARFYQLLENEAELTPFVPRLIGFDATHHVLMLEDLGNGADCTFLYRSPEQITTEDLRQLVHFLSHLHRLRADPDTARAMQNTAMRQLNHEHIFRYPFLEDNGLDLDTVLPGLQAASLPYKRDASLKKRVAARGERYLRAGDTLIHGDYYPGSWLRAEAGVRVIDPEFGHYGCAEFDVGVMLAHALLTGGPVYTPDRILALYEPGTDWDESLARSFAGVEVLRRLLGLAQLPLTLILNQRVTLLERAAALL